MKDIRIFADGVYIGRADSVQVTREVLTVTGRNGIPEHQESKIVTLQFTGVEYTNARSSRPKNRLTRGSKKDQSYVP